MNRYSVDTLLEVEELGEDRARLTARIGEIIYNSSNLKVDVETLSTETGEFRLTLQGCLEDLRPAIEQPPLQRRRPRIRLLEVTEATALRGGRFED
jgi:hypothetical protein